MERIYTKDTIEKIDEKVLLSGWIHARRDHGKIIFIDLRDLKGIIQLVFSPLDKNLYKMANELKSEDVVSVEGKVSKRPDGMINQKINTGSVEVQVEKMELLSRALDLPFEVSKDTKAISEDVRMKYRYLDLRTDRMKENIWKRSKLISEIKKEFQENGFCEIETPLLTKSTPEGARDFLVASRQQPGKFYALPQSPQQFKQLLMVSGIEKYFQIARALRDEDPRGDRQAEHSQLDMEVSFMSRDEILKLNEEIITKTIKKIYPDKNFTFDTFKTLTHKECMEKYKSDKPDLRKNKKDENELAFAWVLDFPLFEKDEKGNITYSHNPFTRPKEEDLDKLMNGKDLENICSEQYDLVLNGYEIASGSLRTYKPEVLEKVFEILGHSKEKIKERFGQIIEAFKYGVPPHGGIAWGLDRIIMILQNEENIREVIAFPKTGDGRDLLMDAPSEVSDDQLKELKIEIKNKK